MTTHPSTRGARHRTPSRPRRSAVLAACLALSLGAAALPAAATNNGSFGSESARLSAGLQQGVAEAGFDTLVDFSNNNGRGAAKPAEHLPNVDVAVIELTSTGKVAGAANVLYDRDSPDGYRVSIDPRTLAAKGVEFSRWRLERWDDQALWDAGPAAGDITVPAATPDKRYMVAYPASVLKVMVAYSIYRLVDDGRLELDDPITYHEDPTAADEAGRTCGYGPSQAAPVELRHAQADGATDTLASWLDQMTTVSDNFATCVLLQEINDQGALQEANDHFQRLGLPSLRMQPRYPVVGNGWSTGTMSMGALDTAKLMLLVSGAPGVLWTAPDGSAVTARSGISEASRSAYRADLAEQSFNEVLNPVNLCGSPDAVQGIPSTVPQRWVDADGHVVTYDGDLEIDFGYDTRPCDSVAEVAFEHKTGLTYNAGGDAGIVRALPGQDGRWYVVAALTSVGYRFGDPDWANSKPNACEGSPYVCYPRAFGRVGKAVDDLVKARPASAR
jgi:hypothetical protein